MKKDDDMAVTVEPPAIVQIFTGPRTVTLPIPKKLHGFAVYPMHPEPIRVFDQDGRLIATVPLGYETDFEVKEPRWWQIWRRANDLRWEQVRSFKR